jgi:hypothetical protein
MDVYQGRNATNVNIDSRCLNLPTTMKAVVNAMFQTNLVHKTEEGYRCISMDNRYQCPELAVLLMKRFKILSTGTCRRNRKGWRPDLMDMAATTGGKGRGDSKMAFDRVNGILLIQWRDSRVVNCVSSILDTTLEATRRQIGRTSKIFSVPRPLKVYHRFMFAVDKGDQSRMHLGGFARKAHFQKWYKKSFFGILDCMLLNSWIAWNMSMEEMPLLRRNKFERFEFYEWIATAFLEYSEDETPATASIMEEAPAANAVETCRLVNVKVERDANRECIVCRLDARYSNNMVGVKKRTLFCETCNAYIHVLHLDDAEKRPIHDMFQGLTCHQILKSEIGTQVWCTGDAGRRSVRTKHPFVKELRTKLEYTGSNKRKRPSEP